MKKVFFLLAVAGMFSFAACNQAAETPTDTVAPVEQPAEEAAPVAADTNLVEDAAAEVAEVATEVVNQ